ncbi:hypothetical protein CKF54_00295 [Psittacicella hinzii]|uniref:Uncharacterized protein n=2 Tax=Psittacicella hinzii TaxID=2028575 RepID=A0A3A1YB57_9GAMM|nr:hypothetical protein CKF54_00295 [Psittacicella hinzii]
MLLQRKAYHSDKYEKLFIFRNNYRRLVNMWKASVIIIFVLMQGYYFIYHYISYSNIIAFSIFFILISTLTLYSIGLYALFPIKQEQSLLYYTLLDIVANEQEDPNVGLNMTYYGFAVLLNRFDKLPAVKFPEVYKMIKQLSRAEDEFSNNQEQSEEDKRQAELRKKLEKQAEEEFKKSTSPAKDDQDNKDSKE